MKEDVYGPMMRDALIAAGSQGLTASELREQIGCSRQRVYSWMKDNAGTMRAVDKAPSGGIRYVWVDSTRSPRGTPVAAGRGAEGIEVGTELRVTRLRWVSGKMEVTLVGPDGIELTVEL